MKEKNKQKLLLVLPLLSVPFLILLFLILGGGETTAGRQPVTTGLNTKLPSALTHKDSARDKLSFYEWAKADSLNRAEQTRHAGQNSDSVADEKDTDIFPRVNYQPQIRMIRPVKSNIILPHEDQFTEVVNPAEQRMPASKPDPELEEINSMLDKLKELQHPISISNAMSAFEARHFADGISTESQEENYFGRKSKGVFAGFPDDDHKQTSGIVAVTPIRQILQSGSVVKFSLLAAVSIHGFHLTAGSHLYGMAMITGERLLVDIYSIRSGDQIIPVQLSVYDMDGMEGLYVPGTPEYKVIKESADNSIQSSGLTGLDLSLKTQAASAGIGAIKSLLTKTVKATRVTVEAGYRVLLYDKRKRN